MSRLHEIESQIRDVYRWWAEQAPGVTPKEEGVLADLWAQADAMYELVPEIL